MKANHSLCENIVFATTTEEPEVTGYSITRTALYYRLARANVHHRDGKRHVDTVPVKLLKPQTVARKAHVDHEFAKAVCVSDEEFAWLFDPDESRREGLSEDYQETNGNSDARGLMSRCLITTFL